MTWRRALLGLALLAGLALAAVAWWWRGSPPAPPVVDLTDADPEVAALVEKTRAEVLTQPRSGPAWGKLGKVLRAHGFADESSSCFAQAEQLDPREPRWPYYRGLTLVLTEPAEGLACLRRAVARWQDAPIEPRFRLAEVLLEQGELDEAGEVLGQAKEQDAGHPRGHLLRARLALARQRWREVLTEVRGCWDDRCSRRQARLLAAEAHQRLKEPARAEQALAEAGQLSPDWPWVDPLVADVERLVVGVRARLVWADSLARQGQPDQAVGVLEQLVEEYPRNVSAWVQLGQVLRDQGRHAAAEQAFSRAVEVDPGSVEGWFGLGVVRYFLGKRDQALAAFREAAHRKPDHTLAHFNVGQCLKEAGDREAARKAFAEALRSQPDYAPARQALAELDRQAAKKP
jgi:tetratricopeptide (TPR) repeat protein